MSALKRATLAQPQFDSYAVLDSLHVHGRLTPGDYIADLEGLKMV